MSIIDQFSSVYFKHWGIVALIITASITLNIITPIILNWLINRFKHVASLVIVLKSIQLPLRLVIILLAVKSLLHYFSLHIQVWEYFEQLMMIMLLAMSLYRILKEVGCVFDLKIQAGESQLNRTTLRALIQMGQITLGLVLILMILEILGVPLSGVLAFGGLGGISVAFAAKELLSNLFGGLMIYLDRPFEVGDWIRSPDKEIEGTVEYIGWRLTRIRTFEQQLRYVPNSAFSSITVDNPSRMRNRRIKTNIGIRYDDSAQLRSIISNIKNMLIQHDAIDTRRILLVNLVEFGDCSLNIQIYTFTKTLDWAEFMAVREEIFMNILELIKKSGADFAFPTRTLHHINE